MKQIPDHLPGILVKIGGIMPLALSLFTFFSEKESKRIKEQRLIKLMRPKTLRFYILIIFYRQKMMQKAAGVYRLLRGNNHSTSPHPNYPPQTPGLTIFVEVKC